MSGNAQSAEKQLAQWKIPMMTYKIASVAEYILLKQTREWHKKGARTMTTKTYKCKCGHLAYFIKGRGWLCMCNNPQRFNAKAGKAQ
jgi:hypothetical protein